MLSLVVFLIVFIVIGFTIFMDCKKKSAELEPNSKVYLTDKYRSA